MLNEISIQPHICDFLASHNDLWGSKLVLVLLSKPDEPIHAVRLSHIIEPPEFPPWKYERFTRKFEFYCGIPQTDYKTLREIDKRLIKLIAIKAELVVHKLDFAHIEEEMQSLVDYRKETTTPTGRIKNFQLENKKEIQRHQKAFNRLLDKALLECPEAYYYFKRHVQTGLCYKWISFPDEEVASHECQPQKKKNSKPRINCHRRC